MLILKYKAVDLKLSEIFEVSSNARTLTEAIDVEIIWNDLSGYGQASFPPYMSEKREENLTFLSAIQLDGFNSPCQLDEIKNYLDTITPLHRPVKAAIDMALYDLMGKMSGLPLYKLLGLETQRPLQTSFTIGIGKDDFILRQLGKASEFEFLKIKLGSDTAYNYHVINLIGEHTGQSLGVDFNQGLKDKETALEMINWLAEKDVEYVEQPLPDSHIEDYAWLKTRSPLDIYGDESIQTATDIIQKKDVFHGVNIKLMKCGGISRAYDMARLAKNLNLKTMLGCMVESGCAISAAAHLGSLFDRLDLDGHLNIANDPYRGVEIRNGLIVLPELPGLGVEKTSND